MPRKRSVRDEVEVSRPRQLRKRLRKAEDQLADAQQKRDRAQARVEALSIIADEIRAQLAEAEKATVADADDGAAGTKAAAGKPAPTKKSAGARKPASASTPAEPTDGESGAQPI